MNALPKFAAVLAAMALFSSALPAQAAMGPCMAMMTPGGGPACSGRPASAESPEACPAAQGQTDKAPACGGSPQMAGMMGNMAAGGMGIAMAVMGAIFGTPQE